ncbi:hypothetical protein BDV96DRAFT_660747 [Lophiotrema nucula]|uniref:Uncharacterized protein n=1 Tax=Lophiotrema nucula TaxID=690887 RepID=A0A6A5Z7M3_9PLEO|nr:hypothetical protein BDV96DRAFT_660747 [Lophiotrema nucula]
MTSSSSITSDPNYWLTLRAIKDSEKVDVYVHDELAVSRASKYALRRTCPAARYVLNGDCNATSIVFRPRDNGIGVGAIRHILRATTLPEILEATDFEDIPLGQGFLHNAQIYEAALALGMESQVEHIKETLCGEIDNRQLRTEEIDFVCKFLIGTPVSAYLARSIWCGDKS